MASFHCFGSSAVLDYFLETTANYLNFPDLKPITRPNQYPIHNLMLTDKFYIFDAVDFTKLQEKFSHPILVFVYQLFRIVLPSRKV